MLAACPVSNALITPIPEKEEPFCGNTAVHGVVVVVAAAAAAAAASAASALYYF